MFLKHKLRKHQKPGLVCDEIEIRDGFQDMMTDETCLDQNSDIAILEICSLECEDT